MPPHETASVLWDKAEDFEKAALQSAEGLADDAAPDRHGRVFCIGAEEGVTVVMLGIARANAC